MIFKKVERKKLYELIADEIEEVILSGTYEIGSKLPSEQSIAEQFEVSRNIVREAMKILQERRLISVVDGSGAFVTKPSSGATSDALTRYLRLLGMAPSIEALYEIRSVIEVANVRLAALRAGADDIVQLENAMEKMRECAKISIDLWTEADLHFHLIIAQTTHNPLMTVMLEPLVNQWRGVIGTGYSVEGGVSAGLDAHKALLAAIKNNDPDTAAEIMMEHLEDSKQRTKIAFEIKEKEQS